MLYRLFFPILFLTSTFVPSIYAQHGVEYSNGKEFVYLVLPGIDSDEDAKNYDKVRVALECRGQLLKMDPATKKFSECFEELSNSKKTDKVILFYDYIVGTKNITTQHIKLSTKRKDNAYPSQQELYCMTNYNGDTGESTYGVIQGELVTNQPCIGTKDTTLTISNFYKFEGQSKIGDASSLAPNIFIGREGEVYIHKFTLKTIRNSKNVMENFYVVRVK